MYTEIYNLIANLIFDGSVVANSYPDLICTAVSSFFVLALLAMPLILIWRIIRSFF